MDGGDTIEILVALVLVGAVGYVVSRTLMARQRGEDLGQAAAGAIRTVGPPVILAVAGLVALSIFAALAGIFLLLALIAALTGDNDPGLLILLWFAGAGVLVMTVVGAVAWGLVRVLRSGRDRAN